MSVHNNIEWGERLVDELNDAKVGVGANWLIDFYERHDGNDVFDLAIFTPTEACGIIIQAFEDWKTLETDGPGDLVQWDN